MTNEEYKKQLKIEAARWELRLAREAKSERWNDITWRLLFAAFYVYCLVSVTSALHPYWYFVLAVCLVNELIEAFKKLVSIKYDLAIISAECALDKAERGW